MKIEPIETLSLIDTVEQHILEAIRAGNLRAGDALPGEKELAEKLGISRPVVREALSRLRMLGLLNSRKRRGMELAHPDIFSGLDRVMHPVFLDEATRKDLFGIRLVLEMGLADLLFREKSEKDLAALDKIVEQESKSARRLVRLECEIEFHARLYRMARNQTLARFQLLLRPFFESVLAHEDHRQPGVITHKDLVRTFRTGTAEEFREAMRKHLEPHFAELREETYQREEEIA